jgi:hypothetical protein
MASETSQTKLVWYQNKVILKRYTGIRSRSLLQMTMQLPCPNCWKLNTQVFEHPQVSVYWLFHSLFGLICFPLFPFLAPDKGVIVFTFLFIEEPSELSHSSEIWKPKNFWSGEETLFLQQEQEEAHLRACLLSLMFVEYC